MNMKRISSIVATASLTLGMVAFVTPAAHASACPDTIVTWDSNQPKIQSTQICPANWDWTGNFWATSKINTLGHEVDITYNDYGHLYTADDINSAGWTPKHSNDDVVEIFFLN